MSNKQKGFAVISGSSSVVAKIMENGTVVFGQDKAVNMRVSGTLVLDLPPDGAAENGRVVLVDSVGSASLGKLDASNVVVDPSVLSGSDVQTVLESLSTEISVEASTRVSAESTLSGDLSAEIYSLDNRVDVLLGSNADELSGTLDTIIKIKEYLDGDGSTALQFVDLTTTVGELSGELSTETSARETLSSDVSADISTETSAREALSSDVSVDISTEASARETLSSDVSADISGETSARETLSSDVSADISGETSAREQLSSDVSADISGETSAREQLSSDVSASISTETSAREQLSSDVSADISTEASAREQLSSDVSANISTEASAREQLSSDVSADISTETSAREQLSSDVSSRFDGLSVIGTASQTEVTDNGDTWTVGLASDVSISNSLTVNGPGSFKAVSNVLDGTVDTSTLSAMAAVPASHNGKFFYLAGSHAGFPQANKWYFCEGDEWYPSPFYGV